MSDQVHQESIPCPPCRRHIPVPHPGRSIEEWASSQFKTGLVIHSLMNSLVHSITDTDNCSVCKKEGNTIPATHWCSECEISLCDECFRQHNRMPALSHHGVSDLTEETPREQMRKKKFVCKEHDEKIKLFCKDCKKTLCTVCCSVDHRACKEVVTIQAMLPEVKQELKSQQKTINDKVQATSKLLNGFKRKSDEFPLKTRQIRAEITTSFKAAADVLQRKEKQLLHKVDDIEDQKAGELKAKIKCEDIARQTYQQQSQFIQQALMFEDEAQLYEMYLSSGSGAVAGDTESEREDRTDVLDISFTHNMENLREDIDMMDVTTVSEDVFDLTAPPVLQEVVDMKLGNSSTDLRDILVLDNNGIKSIIVNDCHSHNIKSVYEQKGRKYSSQLKVNNCPWHLAVLEKRKIVVSVPVSKQILTVGVNPDLVLLSTITTSKEYYGMAVLDQFTLVVGSPSSPSVDVLDMTGNVLRSFTTLTSIQKSVAGPYFVHVTNNGNIMVSDYGLKLKSVICLTPTGDVVFHYSPTGDRALTSPEGITSTTTGDILLADNGTHKVIHLSQSGEFVKDSLTSLAGIQHPFGLCLDGDRLYVATTNNGVHVFKFSRK